MPNSSRTVRGRSKRKYTKRQKPTLALPQGLPETARQVSIADPDALARGELWVQTLDGQWVNAATPDVAAFDTLVRSYFELPDPNWSFFWRSWMLSQGQGKLPLFHVKPEHLTDRLKEQFETLGIAQQAGESSQSRFLAQQGPGDEDDGDEDEEPEPIAAHVDTSELATV